MIKGIDCQGQEMGACRMTEIWEAYKAVETPEIIEIEAEKRAENPDLYDAALAISPFDKPGYINQLIIENRIEADDRIIITGKPLLFLAIVHNRLETVGLLVEHGADLSFRSMDKEYLFWALRSNCDLPLIEVLQEKGNFDFDAATLHVMVNKCEEETILALAKGQNLDVIENIGDEENKIEESLFELAVRHHLYATAHLILDAGCPNTLAKLKEEAYLEVLAAKIERPPFAFDFSSKYDKKRQRKKGTYSKEALIRLRELLEAQLA